VAWNSKKARDSDRDAAIEVVEAAWADGQIVEADRDKRVEELLRAQTMQEINTYTQDLQPPAPDPSGAPRPAYGAATTIATVKPDVAAVPLKAQAGGSKVACGLMLLIPLGLIGAVIGVIAAIVSAVQSSNVLAPGEDPGIGQVNTMSQEGYAELIDDLVSQTGSSVVFEAVLYPGYAVMQVPVDSTTNRYEYRYWDGSLDEATSKSTTDYERFNLTEVDPAVIVALVDEARSRVEDPESWYAIVRRPDDEYDNGTWISAYATNEFGESAYLGGDLEGNITWEPPPA
jgi:hypothetical protein